MEKRLNTITGNTKQVFEEERPISVHVDNFNQFECRAGGEHQWMGDGIVYYEDFGEQKEMSQRKYRLLSDRMRKNLNVVGGESTCNKCGIRFSLAFNPYIQ